MRANHVQHLVTIQGQRLLHSSVDVVVPQRPSRDQMRHNDDTERTAPHARTSEASEWAANTPATSDQLPDLQETSENVLERRVVVSGKKEFALLLKF